MTNPNLTHITVVLDRSGSMQSIDKDAVGGFNAFVDDQKTQPGEATMTLIRFDDSYEVDYVDKPVKDVPHLTTVGPRGGTAMNDAIGRSIAQLGASLQKLPEDKRPGRVIFVIITDGDENSSKEYTRQQVKQMVEHQTQKYNWQFTFLAANQDGVLAGQGIGVSAGLSATFAGNNAPIAFMAASSLVRSYRAGGSELTSYSADARSAMVDATLQQAASK